MKHKYVMINGIKNLIPTLKWKGKINVEFASYKAQFNYHTIELRYQLIPGGFTGSGGGEFKTQEDYTIRIYSDLFMSTSYISEDEFQDLKKTIKDTMKFGFDNTLELIYEYGKEIKDS